MDDGQADDVLGEELDELDAFDVLQHLDGLAQSVHACVEVLSGARTDEFPTGVGPSTKRAIADTWSAQRSFWKQGT